MSTVITGHRSACCTTSRMGKSAATAASRMGRKGLASGFNPAGSAASLGVSQTTQGGTDVGELSPGRPSLPVSLLLAQLHRGPRRALLQC